MKLLLLMKTILDGIFVCGRRSSLKKYSSGKNEQFTQIL